MASTVAVPLEQQINGVENMLYMQSSSLGSGTMQLTVTFALGTDPDQATINVNNRVQRVLPTLPQEVQRTGVRVDKKSSSILQAVILHDESGQYDPIYLNNYALLNVIDDLKRAGVACIYISHKLDEIMELADRVTVLRDGQLIATAYYYRMLYHMQQFARILGRPDDFSALSDSIKSAFGRRFLNSAKGNTVTANLLPLYFGMVPAQQQEAVFKKITENIRIQQNFHISTGVIGTQWLMRGLTKYDRPDIAYTLATNRDYPSWGYMVEHGATTVWELWNGNTANPGMNSGNHVMLLGDLLTWYYENLAGIKSDSAAVAFKQLIMKPAIIDGLNEIKASYRSMYGLDKK